MAITRAQQVRQMLEDGGMLVQPSMNGKRPGYRSAKAQEVQGRTPKTSTFDARSEDETTPQDRQEVQRDTSPRLGEFPPGYNPKTGRFEKPDGTPEDSYTPPTKEEINKIFNLDKDGKPKKKGFIESFNEKKRKRNQEYLRKLRNKKFQGIMNKYGLTEEQLNMLLEGDDEFEGGRNLSFTGLQQLLDMDPSARNLGEDFNEALMQGKLGELALSKRMAKGVPLSTAELFSTTDPTTRIELPGVLSKIQGPETFSNVLSGLNRIQTLDEIINNPKGVTQSDIDNYFNLTMGKGGTDPITKNTVDALFTPRDDDGPSQVTDPCKGPNPPAYCFIGEKAEETIEAQRNLGGVAPRFAGSIFDFTGMADGGRIGADEGGIMMASAPDPMDTRNDMMQNLAIDTFGKPLKDLTEDEIIQIEEMMMEMDQYGSKPKSRSKRAMAQEGGIMDLETGRQMYFLGKLVKKATRAVKKIAKSPIGKAALLGGALYFGGGGAGGFSGLLKKGLLKKGATEFTLANLSPMKAIGLASLGSLFLTPKEEEDDPYRGPDIDIANIRANPYNFLTPRFTGTTFAAEGGRMGYQEGSKEPVATKTMPLLDMDGKEMDLRDNGGFVPIGRMEKADDVPARLSKNEFVFTADAVRNAGDGDVDKGAEVMYNMMKNLEAGGEVSEESQGLEGAREMFQTSKRLEEVL